MIDHFKQLCYSMVGVVKLHKHLQFYHKPSLL